ncbi:MAG: ABC transporter permease [Spirochaetaceae bacterium]
MIGAVVKKEFRQILRDTRTLSVLVFIPVFLLVMFGYAISLDVENVPLAVIDYDRSAESRRLVRSFTETDYFTLEHVPPSVMAIEELLDSESARAGLVIPVDFSAKLAAGKQVPVQLIVDGANSTTGAAVLGYARAIVREFGAGVEARGPSGGAAAASAITLAPQVWFNPELESSVYLIPGLVAFILVVTAVVSASLSLVREKELGTMEQLVASPLSAVDIVVGKTVPYMVLSIVVAGFVFGASVGIFGIEIAGSVALLIATTLLFLLACLGLGIMISTISDSQQVAFLISTLSTLLPSFLLSGFVFPIENMPPVVRAFTYLVPARYYLSALRAVVLRGSGVGAFRQELVALGVFALVMMTVSVVRLRRVRHSI